MAIAYCRVRILSVERGESPVAFAAYIARTSLRSRCTGERYRCAKQKADLLHGEILLPVGADPQFLDPEALWSDVEEAEVVTDRKTGKDRWRSGAQFAYDVTLALPKELSLAENRDMLRSFVEDQFVRHGVAAQIAIHRPHDAQTGNIHAHVLVTTRFVEGGGLGLKARCLKPGFSVGKNGKGFVAQGHDWPGRWRDHQERFFRTRGIPISVDPVSVVPGVHVGKAMWVHDSERILRNRLTREDAAAVVRDPAALLAAITERQAVLGLGDLIRQLRRDGLDRYEAKRRALAVLDHPEVVALEPDPALGGLSPNNQRVAFRRYTTRAVLAMEDRIRENVDWLYMDLALAEPLPETVHAATERLIAERGLDPEQAAAVRHCLEGPGIRVVQGIAGAGKSFTSGTLRDALQAGGYAVIGLGPTNTVAADLRASGFKTGLTIHRFLMEIDNGRRQIAPRTCFVVDEAAMVQADLYDRLLKVAARHRCRVVLVGDDRQLAPIGRGGIYSMIRRSVGSAELTTVRRQSEPWMREASRALSLWNVGPAIRAYAERGSLVWSRTLEASAEALVAQWGRDVDADPDANRFVYCGTNLWVNELNRRLQARRWQGRPAAPAFAFETCRGSVRVRVGDRIQFHKNDPRLGIYNGVIGNIANVAPDRIEIVFDDGGRTAFDPRAFSDWGLGYAGTVHRGQGKTQTQVYALYDHPFVWAVASTYVALTRHRTSMRLFVPRELARDEAMLVAQMARAADQPCASDLVAVDRQHARREAAEALSPLLPPVAYVVPDEQGRPVTLDLNRPRHLRLARDRFRALPAAAFAAEYQALQARTKGEPRSHAYARLGRLAAGVARVRGFRPESGAPAPDCLTGYLTARDREGHRTDAILAPKLGEIDIRPLVIDGESIELRVWRKLGKRLRRLDRFVRDAVLARVQAIRARVPADGDLAPSLNLAAYLVRASDAIRARRYGRGPDRLRSVRDLDATPRLTWGAFKLWRRATGGELEPLRSPKRHPAAHRRIALTGRSGARPPVVSRTQRTERMHQIE